MFHLRLFLILALCGLRVQPAQAESVDSLAVSAEHSAATQQKSIANGIRVLGGGKRAAVRIPTKVVFGTLSGVAFTAIGVGVAASMDDRSSENTHADIGYLLIGMFIGSSVGFPLGVSAVDPYDSLSKTLLVGVIPGVAGYFVMVAGQETGFLLSYVGPIIGSLYASEKWRKPLSAELKSKPQAPRISVGLAPTLNGGLSAAATLRF